MDIVDSLQFLLKGVTRSAPHPALFTWSPTSPSHSASVLLNQHPHLRAFVWSLLLLLWKLLPQTITWFPHPPSLFRSQLKYYSSERPALVICLPDNPVPLLLP